MSIVVPHPTRHHSLLILEPLFVSLLIEVISSHIRRASSRFVTCRLPTVLLVKDMFGGQFVTNLGLLFISSSQLIICQRLKFVYSVHRCYLLLLVASLDKPPVEYIFVSAVVLNWQHLFVHEVIFPSWHFIVTLIVHHDPSGQMHLHLLQQTSLNRCLTTAMSISRQLRKRLYSGIIDCLMHLYLGSSFL